MDAKSIEHIPCPLCKAMIRSQQSFVKKYMDLCEHCKNKFALKFCICKNTAPAERRQEKYDKSDHKERYAVRDRRGIDKGWIELSPEQKLLKKDEIFFKNMNDFFRNYPACPQKTPKYKIRPLVDDRLYGNVEDFFRKIGPSPSYDSVSSPRYDDRAKWKRDGKYKHYGTDQGVSQQDSVSDRDSFRSAGPVMYDREYYSTSPIPDESHRRGRYGELLAADDDVRVSVQRERQHKYYISPEMDGHRQVVETRERIHKHYCDGSADDDQVLETTERHYTHFRDEQIAGDDLRVSEKYDRHRKYYSRPLSIDNRRSISERPSEYSGPGRVIETHERYLGGPVMDDHGRVSERRETSYHKYYGGHQRRISERPSAGSLADGYRPGAAKGYARRSTIGDPYSMTERHERGQEDSYGRQDGRRETAGRFYRSAGGPSLDDLNPIGSGPLGAQTAPDMNVDHKGRRADRTLKGYVSESDKTVSSSRATGKKKGTRKGDDDDILLVHERGAFKYAEKSPEVEKFKEYMQEVREQQKREKDQAGGKWATAGKKKGLKSKIRVKIKSDKDSQKRESQKEKEAESDEREEVLKDIDEASLKMQSNDGIVPIKEAALHLKDLDKRTSENQARMIEERLIELASKRKKPIIVEFIKRKKKSPRIRTESPDNFSRLYPMKNIIERRKKENIEPEKTSELDALNVSSSRDRDSIIIGPKLYQYKPPLKESEETNLFDPLVHKVMPVVEYKLEMMPIPEPMSLKKKKGKGLEKPSEVKRPAVPIDQDNTLPQTDDMSTDGIISYALSDRKFIEKGWSKLPTEHIVRRINVYRMRPTHPESDWFERNKCNERMQYETGERFAEFDNETGNCQLYYKNGKIALDYYKSEEPLTQKRIVIYSKSDLCWANKPQSVLAIFDYFGNGVVFDLKGKIRLKFNQSEGIVFDKSLGPNCHWEWHRLNDPPELKHIMVDTNLIYKDQNIFKVDDPHNVPNRLVDEAIHAIELDNIVKQKKNKMTLPYKRFPIRIKTVKINDQFTLLIIDQATIYIKFKEGSTFFKTNIGMILDHNEIVDTVTEKLGAVMNSVERRPAATESLAELQRALLRAQREEKRFQLRDRRINRPADHNAELDKKMTLLSKPLRKVPSPLKPLICNCDLVCTCAGK